jgi:ABC-type sugar transport system permease subunit
MLNQLVRYVLAVPVSVAAGIVTAMVLRSILPHNPNLKPLFFFTPLIAGALCGIVVLRWGQHSQASSADEIPGAIPPPIRD